MRTTRSRSRTRSSSGASAWMGSEQLLILNNGVGCGTLPAKRRFTPGLHAAAGPPSPFQKSPLNRRPRRRSMNAETQDLKAELLRTDEEFTQLVAKHHELEDRLYELTAKHYLSEPEQIEQVTLKKRKLQLKDKMEDILRRHRAAQS